MTPRRRADDPSPDITPDAADALFAGLPQVIAELRRGRIENRRHSETNRVLWAVLLAAFAIVSLRTEVNADAIKNKAATDRAANYTVCRAINDNARKFNQLIDTLVMRTQASTTIPQDQKRDAARLYRSAKQTIPACTPTHKETP